MIGDHIKTEVGKVMSEGKRKAAMQRDVVRVRAVKICEAISIIDRHERKIEQLMTRIKN